MYKINSSKVQEETLWTEVTYTLKDGTEVKVDVSHFCPKDKAEVLSNIEKRLASEQAKYDAMAKNELIKVEVDKMVVKK